MTDQPTDPNDETQPHDAFDWRPVERRPDDPAPAVPPVSAAGADAGMASFSPAPGPRTEWTQPRWSDPEPTPEHWFESAAPVRPVTPVAATTRRGAGAGTVIAAALAAAVLASGGTVVALTASGAFDKTPAAAAGTFDPNTQTIKQPVTLDENSAIIDVAAKAGPSVVRIFTTGIDPNSVSQQPQDGVGWGSSSTPTAGS